MALTGGVFNRLVWVYSALAFAGKPVHLNPLCFRAAIRYRPKTKTGLETINLWPMLLDHFKLTSAFLYCFAVLITKRTKPASDRFIAKSDPSRGCPRIQIFRSKSSILGQPPPTLFNITEA